MTEYNVSAKVVADSVSPKGERLITLEVNLHRFILAQLNTHKAVSRNYQSSRAVPVLRQLEQIIEHPAMPVFYGKNQSGMAVYEELPPNVIEECEAIILRMRNACVEGVERLHELGLSKQSANRYVEPWMWTKGVVTATQKAWEAIFKLRLEDDSQQEFQELAKAIKEAIDNSEPKQLKYGDWHLPYVFNFRGSGNPEHGWEDKQFFVSNPVFHNDKDNTVTRVGYFTLEQAIKVSASCIAQVSYRRLDESLDKAERVFNMLHLPSEGVYENSPHYSAVEHQLLCYDSFFEQGIGKDKSDISGNFQSWEFYQLRKMYEQGVEKKFICG